MHPENDAEIPDHGRDDVTLPAAVGGEQRRIATEPDGCRVDRFLAEGAESFSLERSVPVTDLAAGEELLEPVVGGPGEQHSAQNFAALVSGQ